jgi:hypothetical protein
MIQILLHGLKMDPLVSLHYYAPVCAAINLLVLPFTEGLAPFYELARVGPFILISNALVAFLLNVAAVFLVGAGSSLVLTLAGVLKVCIAPDSKGNQSDHSQPGHSPHLWLRSDIWSFYHAITDTWLLDSPCRPCSLQDIRVEVGKSQYEPDCFIISDKHISMYQGYFMSLRILVLSTWLLLDCPSCVYIVVIV